MPTLNVDGTIEVHVFGRPPDRLDPRRATAAQLRAAGLPEPPAEPGLRRHYFTLVEQLLSKKGYLEPQLRVAPVQVDVTRADTALLPPADPVSADSAGSVVVAPAGGSIRWVQSQWIVPTVTAAPHQGDFLTLIWTGIGGGGPTSYLAGIHMHRSGGKYHSYPFWQWITANGTGHILDVTNFFVRPGDLMYVLLCTEFGAGSTSGTVYFFNRTVGTHVSFGVTGPKLDASSVEWGVGGPFPWNGSASTLGNYGEVFLDESFAATDNWDLVGAGDGNIVSMTVDGSVSTPVVSAASRVTSRIVRCHYRGMP